MMTPAEVAAQLVARGYGDSQKRVERALTDWRAKHLMPALTKRGRGQGSGTLNYWPQIGVVDQAIAVYRIFAANQPADAVLIGIWLLGFEVPISEVPAAWLRLIDTKLEGRIFAKLAKGQIRADVMTDASQPGIRRASRMLDIKRLKIEIAALEVADMVFDPAYQFDEEANEVIAKSIEALIAEKQLFGVRSPNTKKLDLRPIIDSFRASQSVDGMKNLISSSSHDDFLSARDLWLQIWQLVLKFLPGLRVEKPDQKLTDAQEWSIICGRHAIPAILQLLRSGHRPRVERTLSLIENAQDQLDLRGEVTKVLLNGEISPSFQPLISALAELWNYRTIPLGN